MKKLIIILLIIGLISVIFLPDITAFGARMGMDEENRDKKWAENLGFLACQTNIRFLRYGSAIDLCKDFINTWPDSEKVPEAYYYLALSYENDDQIDKAMVTYKKFEDKFPNHMWIEQAESRRRRLEALEDIAY
jgi:outer membrane protein assembly factor BamD (BamD/ComL family)